MGEFFFKKWINSSPQRVNYIMDYELEQSLLTDQLIRNYAGKNSQKKKSIFFIIYTLMKIRHFLFCIE